MKLSEIGINGRIKGLEDSVVDFETTSQLNSRDTANRDRANHTGTQTLATISDAGAAAAAGVKNSIEINSGDVQLVGDTASPGNNKLYGTNASGVRGFYDIPVSGDVVGPASATDEHIAVFDGTTGKLLKGGGVAVSGLATSAQGALADSAVQPAREVATGTGLTGGGDLSANRTIALDAGSIASLALADSAVQPARSVSAGTGLDGGGDLSANRTIGLSSASQSSLALADSAVQPAREVATGTGLTGGGDLSENRTIALDAGSIASLGLADSALQAADIANFETTTQLNSRDTANRDRANHTGTQTLATISDAGTAAAAGTKNSVEINSGDLQLVGDAATPGNSRYYGTNSSGTKGFYELPAGGGGGTWGSITGTLSDQTDLQGALDGKVNSSAVGTAAAANLTSSTTDTTAGRAAAANHAAMLGAVNTFTNSQVWQQANEFSQANSTDILNALIYRRGGGNAMSTGTIGDGANNTAKWFVRGNSNVLEVKLAGGVDVYGGLDVTGSLSSTAGANFATSSGNVGIGTSSPSDKLHVIGTQRLQGELGFFNATPHSTLQIIPATAIGTSAPNRIATINTTPLAIETGGTERMRIDSAGNVGIGTTSPVSFTGYTTLDVVGSAGGLLQASNGTNSMRLYATSVGGYVGTSSNDPVLVLTNDTERMRITSAGNVGIGTSSPAAKLDVAGQTQTNTILVKTTGGTSSGYLGGRSDWTGGSTDNNLAIGTYQPAICFFTNNNTTERMRIDSAGTITFNAYGAGTLSTNSSGVISASDGRYKTKTRSVENGLDAIAALQPTYFKWDEDSPFASENEELGFIAQEVAAAIPEASPGEDEEGKYRNYHDRAIIAMLVKGMQEQQAQIAQMQAEIETLKGN